ncbi:MAG: tetratricopeptide repeat protein [Bacteroidota bacterium]|nr:tetratricopeptide repeat protein [Bacteroidota bacterium]MDQ6901864.1 tetratricopeptide repeat protein [Bacteroidota bacterium]
MIKRIAVAIGGLGLLFILLVFGKIESPKPGSPDVVQSKPSFKVDEVIKKEKQKLSPQQLIYVSKLENNISRGDLKKQEGNQYSSLASFWKDSAQVFIPYAYYLSEAAKLDNSEKNLTFAARLILENMRREENVAKKTWEAETAASLFEKAIQLDPDNDDLKVGLGSCYVYGQGMAGDPQQTMKGIQQLLQVVRKDSNNMQAQMVLGIGAVISGQTDKAVDRLKKVVAFDPHNLEAVSWLADAYAALGDKENAIKWYGQSKHLVNNPEYSKEVDERIKALSSPH